MYTKLDEMASQKELVEFANDPQNSFSDKKFAVRRIFNKFMDCIIYIEDDDMIREYALENLRYGFDYFLRIISGDFSWRMKLIAFSYISLNYIFNEYCREILGNEAYDGFESLPNLWEIAKNDKVWKKRLVSALILDDKNLFEYLALNDDCEYVRLVAAFQIDNEDILAEIIENDTDFSVVYMASLKLDDDAKLIGIYRNLKKSGKSYIVNMRAIIMNIHDQFFLIDEIYESNDLEICRMAALNICSHEELYEIVTGKKFESKFCSFEYSDLFDIRNHIFSYIRDDELQRDIAINDKRYSIALINETGNPRIFNEFLNHLEFFPASSRVNIIDDETLKNIAFNHPDERSRYDAVLRIFDKEILEKIIENEPCSSVKNLALENLNLDESDFTLNSKSKYIIGEAVRKIKDNSQLINIIQLFNDEYIAQIAVNNIDDDMLLADLVCERPFNISHIAINKISRQKSLARIATKSLSEFDAVYAVSKINDDELLADVLEHSPFPRCYPNAVSRIKSEELLIDIAGNFRDDYARSVAVSKITDQSVLKEFALNDSNYHIRKTALKKINDVSFLKQIAENDADEEVRLTAKRLVETLEGKYF